MSIMAGKKICSFGLRLQKIVVLWGIFVRYNLKRVPRSKDTIWKKNYLQGYCAKGSWGLNANYQSSFFLVSKFSWFSEKRSFLKNEPNIEHNLLFKKLAGFWA